MSSIVIVFIVCFRSIRLFSVDCVVSFTTPKLESTNVFQLQYHFVMHIFYFDNATLYFLLCCTFRDGLRISATELSCINVVSVKQKKTHTHTNHIFTLALVFGSLAYNAHYTGYALQSKVSGSWCSRGTERIIFYKFTNNNKNWHQVPENVRWQYQFVSNKLMISNKKKNCFVIDFWLICPTFIVDCQWHNRKTKAMTAKYRSFVDGGGERDQLKWDNRHRIFDFYQRFRADFQFAK